jgi:hypothetical protein
MNFLSRFALILAGSLVIPACLRAQNPGGAPPPPPAPAARSTNGIGPRIQFNTENYNAGTNLVGEPINYTFLITNTGDETLVISSVHPGCGCTTVGPTTSGGGTLPGDAWTHEIAPGRTGVIPIQVNTSTLRGQINKTVTVTSNDKTRPSVALQITGNVWQPIEVEPDRVYFNLKANDTNAQNQVVKIVNRTDVPLLLSNPRSTTNLFSAVLKTNDPGKEYELTISGVPPPHLTPFLSTVTIAGDISLTSSATNRNPLAISVVESITPEIFVFPTSIQLPVAPLIQPRTETVSFRDTITNIVLSDPSVDLPGVKVALLMVQTNRYYTLSVAFPQGFQVQPGQHVTVKTDNPQFPTISVPISPVAGMPQSRTPAGPPPGNPAAIAAARAAIPSPQPQPARTMQPPVLPRPGILVYTNIATNAAASPSHPPAPANTNQP